MSPTIFRYEVLNISPHGLWLLAASKEYFLPYTEFPWFKTAGIDEIYDVAFLRGHHLRWEKLDIDLELESLERLEQYPLKYR